MKNNVRVLSFCFATLLSLALGAGPAMAQTTAQQSAGGTATTAKHSHAKKSSGASRGASAKLKGEEYSSQMTAKAHCPDQTVVWVNKSSHIFHLPKSKYYGKTKHGSYVCEKAAESAGFRAAKS